MTGAEDDAKAFDVYETSKKVMAEGSFNLRKWNLNSPELLEKINEIEIEVNVKPSDVELGREVSQIVVEDDESYTKSTIGSTVCANEEKVVKL